MTVERSAGWKRLRELFPGRGEKDGQAKLAAAMNVDPGTVSRWFSGERKPSPRERAKLEDMFGIGWRAWDKVIEVDDDEAAEGAA